MNITQKIKETNNLVEMNENILENIFNELFDFYEKVFNENPENVNTFFEIFSYGLEKKVCFSAYIFYTTYNQFCMSLLSDLINYPLSNNTKQKTDVYLETIRKNNIQITKYFEEIENFEKVHESAVRIKNYIKEQDAYLNTHPELINRPGGISVIELQYLIALEKRENLLNSGADLDAHGLDDEYIKKLKTEWEEVKKSWESDEEEKMMEEKMSNILEVNVNKLK